METKYIKLKNIKANSGQIEGLPKNPRCIRDDKFRKLKASIEENPEMLELRELLVYPHGEDYIIIGGNMRYRVCQELGYKELPCKVIPESATVEQLKAYTIKDNSGFGEWDWDALANEWDSVKLEEWGLDFPVMEEAKDVKSFDEEDTEEKEEKSYEEIEAVEELLNEAMKENCAESARQIEHCLKVGFLITGYTVGLAKAHFLRAKYYGGKYPGWMSCVFQPHRISTSANNKSILERMKISGEEGKAGIAGFRTLTGDTKLLTTTTTKRGYPVAGGRMPLDFPAKKAKELIEEFAGKGAQVLDPCHGWGGRFVGALLAGVSSYVGIDPCYETHKGLVRMREAFLPYCPETKEVRFILAPYEEFIADEGVFDFALTSPPYFDVEQYQGENQSHVKFPEYTSWREGFYFPLIERTYLWLKPGAVFALQVGSQTYPLLADAKEIAAQVGFIVEDVRPFGGMTASNLNGNTDQDEENEKIIILRKPYTAAK